MWSLQIINFWCVHLYQVFWISYKPGVHIFQGNHNIYVLLAICYQCPSIFSLISSYLEWFQFSRRTCGLRPFSYIVRLLFASPFWNKARATMRFTLVLVGTLWYFDCPSDFYYPSLQSKHMEGCETLYVVQFFVTWETPAWSYTPVLANK